MCIIIISEKGTRQPNEKEFTNCFVNNPHGAGYMVARDGRVEIHKGFMTYADFIRSVRAERFSADDSVVYHFRISTQGGVNPQMCHPFPYTTRLEYTEKLDLRCALGIAHNGIIPLTTGESKVYSDTALFVADYLPLLIKNKADLSNPKKIKMLEELINSRMVFLDADGEIKYIGQGWIEEKSGLIFSNRSYAYNNLQFRL